MAKSTKVVAKAPASTEVEQKRRYLYWTAETQGAGDEEEKPVLSDLPILLLATLDPAAPPPGEEKKLVIWVEPLLHDLDEVASDFSATDQDSHCCCYYPPA